MKKSILNIVLGVAVVFITSGCANNWNKDWSTSLQDISGSHPVINGMVMTENQKVFFTGYESEVKRDNILRGVYGVADLAGKIDWYKQCNDCPNGVVFYDVVQAPDSFLLLGEEKESEQEGKAWIVKVNSEGEVEWSKRFGKKFLNSINDGIVSPAGNYVFVGTFNKNKANETSDAKLLILNPSGDIVIEKIFNRQVLNNPTSIIVNDEGNYIVSLNTSKQYKTISGQGDDYFSFLLGLDQEGNVVWERKFEEEYSYITDLVLTQDGGAIVLGGITAHHFTPYSVFVKRVTRMGKDFDGFKEVCFINNPLVNKQYFAGTISHPKGCSSYLITSGVMNIYLMLPDPALKGFTSTGIGGSYLIARINDTGEIIDEGELGFQHVGAVINLDDKAFLVSHGEKIMKYSVKSKK